MTSDISCAARRTFVLALASCAVAVAFNACNGERQQDDASAAETSVIETLANSSGSAEDRLQDQGASCHEYPGYIAIAWASPDPQPVAIVRERDSSSAAEPNCSTDSLPGDFVIRNEWAEYFAGMWDDLLFIDSGTSDVRELIIYDVLSRRKVLSVDGAGEMEGWVDSVTVRIWILSGTGLPHSQCPDVGKDFEVGVDSLFALNLRDFKLRALGPWRCNQLQ